MTDMETSLICALAAIDAALGMPEDGCNSTEATITAIKLLHAVHEDDQRRIAELEEEHAQRLTLQHHACDLAQRVADLERHAAHLVAESEAKIPEMQAALEERLVRDRANRLLMAKVADLEAERDRMQHAYHQQREDAQSRVDAAVVRALAAQKECDELRAWKAAIEAQEPAMYVLRSAAKRPQPAVVQQKKYLSCAISDLVDMGLEHLDPLFTRPIPALADARREGAEAMREAAIGAVHSNFMHAATRTAITEDIRAMPIPTGLEVRRG